MNKERRKELEKIIANIEQWKEDVLQLVSRIEDFKSEIELVKDKEEDAYDNLPEHFQVGERGDQMQSVIDSMESAVDSLDEIIGDLESLSGNSVDDIIEYLREAIEV